ncbi:hypothetical protein Lesp02_17680 [Lentzea sp. NBRC 105346]|uniref:hypothetical protein n=1 Tax=Lentzea sp. NBRC 105346 TaxID=3032205 RepID=UPI00249FED2C|nr:hypothetical protein [Lentzea sp. NBRC 105346]GLZ29578.1 hypothetical protein Lesp02_17680 [Lentzea sp. NBRC 105346]
MTRLRKAVASAAVLVGTAVVSIVLPGHANAAEYGCSGALIDTWPVKSPWNTISHIRLYYNSSNGWNCAVNVKTAYYSQFKHDASISMYNEDFREDDNNRPGYNNDFDSGKFQYYAGPVKVYGKGKCVVINADTWYYDEHAHKNTGAVHC